MSIFGFEKNILLTQNFTF